MPKINLIIYNRYRNRNVNNLLKNIINKDKNLILTL